jgi:hypothetical protein
VETLLNSVRAIQSEIAAVNDSIKYLLDRRSALERRMTRELATLVPRAEAVGFSHQQIVNLMHVRCRPARVERLAESRTLLIAVNAAGMTVEPFDENNWDPLYLLRAAWDARSRRER